MCECVRVSDTIWNLYMPSNSKTESLILHSWMLMAAEMECWALHNGIYQPQVCARGPPPHPAGPAACLWWSCTGWEVFSNSHHHAVTTSTGCGGHPRAELASLITPFSSFLSPADHTMKDGRCHQRLIETLCTCRMFVPWKSSTSSLVVSELIESLSRLLRPE